MRTIHWTIGLLRRRRSEVLIAAVSVALLVAFVASMGAFVTHSRADLTKRAAASVPVDWQVEVSARGNPAQVRKAIDQLPARRAVEPVSFAKVDALQSTGPDGVRKTGSAYLVGISASYAAHFPGEIRQLLGSATGPLLFQQTAANLAARPLSEIQVVEHGTSRGVRVAGVVDLPAADSLFQVVGLPPGSGASAPPDNVLLVGPTLFTKLAGSAAVVHQFHVGFDHGRLPADPHAAAVSVLDSANHFQVGIAGGARIGNNLATVLTAAGEDASYANLLFLLLGLPGLALSVVVAGQVTTLRSDRRRREIALLRLRGATGGQIARIVVAESLITAAAGAIGGLALAAIVVHSALPAGTTLSVGWSLAAVLTGLLVATSIQLWPVLRMAIGHGAVGVAAETSRTVRTSRPWPLRLGLDVILLLGAGVAFALTARGGYQVVLAPEGIPQTQVNYAALAGPLLAWPGLALLTWRLSDLAAGHARARRRADRSGRAPELEVAIVRRRRRVIAGGAVALATAVGLAVSTAVFTSTYREQSRVDVALTVGSDVAVQEPPGATVGPSGARALAATPGVHAVEPLQHRFAYVGPDLQDIYGVRAGTFARVAPLQDAYVPGSTIKQTMAKLQATPDGVLLSAETLHDYQLHPGDQIRLRLQTGADHAYRAVPFHVVGQVAEWPTAPKDSFIVANAGYLTKATGSDAVGTFLISTSNPAATARELRSRLAADHAGARVFDTTTSRSSVSTASGLAATDLTGISRIELGFGIVFAVACSGLALLGGIVERRRALVLLAALGASPRQRGRFVANEAWRLVVQGLLGGVVIGSVIAYLLVKVLTGIFDPAPAAPTVPWVYLILLPLVVGAVTVLVVSVAGRWVGRAGPSQLRDL